MPTIVCPNRGLQEWKDLAKEIGEDRAYLAFFRSGDQIPTVEMAKRVLAPPKIEAPAVVAKDLLPSEMRTVGQQWDSTKLGTRIRWLRASGYVTRRGKLTNQSAKWAESKWDTLSDSAKKVIGKWIAFDFPKVGEQATPPAKAETLTVANVDTTVNVKTAEGRRAWGETARFSGKVVPPTNPTQPAPIAKSPLEILSTARQVKISAPKAATSIRVTRPDGKSVVVPLQGIGSINKGDNPLRGETWKKIEAGTIAVSGTAKGQFRRLEGDAAGQVSVIDQTPPKSTVTFSISYENEKLSEKSNDVPSLRRASNDGERGQPVDEGANQEKQALIPSKSVDELRIVQELISRLLKESPKLSDAERIDVKNIHAVEAPAIKGVEGLEATQTAWKAIADAFGQRIIFVELGKTLSHVNAATVKGISNTIFINIRSDRTFSSLIGHEMLHDIENTQPELYGELLSKLELLIPLERLEQYRQWRIKNGLPEGLVKEELIADLFERSFNDPKFWDTLAAKEPSLFDRLAQTVLKFLNSLITKLKDNGVYKHFTDIGKAHDVIAEALVKFKRSNELGIPPESGDVTFARNSDEENISEAAPEMKRAQVAGMGDEPIEDDPTYHQTAGIPGAGTEYKPESIVKTREAIRENVFSAEGPVTPAKTQEFYRVLGEFTNPASRTEAATQLANTVRGITGDDTADLAPALTEVELRDYAVLALVRGDTTPLMTVFKLSDEFATNVGVVASASARALRALKEGTLFTKTLFALTKANLKAEGERLGLGEQLFNQLVNALNHADVDRQELETALRTGKDSQGRTVQDILGLVSDEEVAKQKPKRAKQQRETLDTDAEKTALRYVNKYQNLRGAEWLKPDANKNAIVEFVKEYLKGRLPNDPVNNPTNPDEPYQRPIPSAANAGAEAQLIANDLMDLGVTDQTALQLGAELIQEREVRWGNKRVSAMNRAAESRDVSSLIDDILNTPLQSQVDPAWRAEAAKRWFESNGIVGDQADAAVRLFESQFEKAFQSAQEKIAKGLLAGHPLKSLEAIVKTIRSGLFNPSHTGYETYMAKIGLKGFSKADLQKLAELDQKLSKGLPSYPERVMATDQMLSIIRRNKPMPSVMEAIAANYTVSMLTAIRTHTIHMFAGTFHLLEERILGTLSNWPTATNLTTLWKPLIEAGRHMIDQWRFAAGPGMSYFPIQELEAGQNRLRQLWESGVEDFKSNNPKRRAVGLGKMIAGVQDFSFRILNASNQANVVAVRDAQLVLYGSEAFKLLGLDPKRVNILVEQMAEVRQQAFTDALDRGLSKVQAKVSADDISSRWLSEMFGQETGDPEVSRKVWASAERDGLSSVGRLAEKDYETGQRLDETGEGGIVSRYMGGHWLVRMANRMRAESPEGKIGALYFFGYVGVPYRMARFLAWNSPYGLVRLGINRFRQSRGWENWWKQSLATKYQEQYRLRMALASSIAMILLLAGGAAALGKRKTADDGAGDDEFAWYVTGMGPKNKDLRDAWTRLGFQPESLVLVLNRKVHVAIPITRVGESLGHLLWGFSAADDYAWRKKEAIAAGKQFNESPVVTTFEAVGNYAAIIGERGPVQTLIQMRQGGTSPQMALATAAGKFIAPIVPFSGLQRSVRDMIVGQVDYSTPQAAFEANFPILGWSGSSQAINRFGDPLYDHSWYAKVSRTGVPIAFGVADNTQNRELYLALVDKGVAPQPLRRSLIEEHYGPLTDEQFNQFAKTSGTALKTELIQNLPALQSMSSPDAKKFVAKAVQAADLQSASNLGLVREVSEKGKLAGNEFAGTAPVRRTSTARLGSALQHRVSALRPARRNLFKPKFAKLGHIPRGHMSALRGRRGSLYASHHRRHVFA